MYSTGDRKTSPGTIFPWKMAEDNPVRLWWGIAFEYGRGEMRSYSAGGKLPESTGDKLPAGEMIQTFLGKLLRLDWGSAPLVVRYSVGAQSYTKTVREACSECLCPPLGNVAILSYSVGS